MSRYKLKHLIGAGGMGKVFVADRILPSGETQPVACKVMHPGIWEIEGPALFHREAALTLRIGHNHPGLVTTHEYLEDDDGQLYLIMELIEGCSLDALMQAYGRLPFEMTRLIVEHVLAALAYIHAHDILHRDVSPSNVMITCRGEIKISDFGLARPIPGGSAESSRPQGKVAYCALEVVQGGTIDVRSDLFSLGATLWEMVSGKPPFGRTGTLQQTLLRVARWNINALPDDVPSELRTLAEGWVRERRADREPSTAREAFDAMLQSDVRATGDARREARTQLGDLVTRLYEYLVQARQSEPADASRIIEAVSLIDMSELAHVGGTGGETRDALARSDLALSDTTRWPEPANGSDAETDDRPPDASPDADDAHADDDHADDDQADDDHDDQLAPRKRARRRRFPRGHTRPISPPSGPPDPDVLHEHLAPAPRRRWPVLVLLTAAGIIGYIAAGPASHDEPRTAPTPPVDTVASSEWTPIANAERELVEQPSDGADDASNPATDDPTPEPPPPATRPRHRIARQPVPSSESFEQFRQVMHRLKPDNHCFPRDDCQLTKRIRTP